MLSRISSNLRPKPVVVSSEADAEKRSSGGMMPSLRGGRNTRSIATIDEEKPLADQQQGNNGKRNNRRKLTKRLLNGASRSSASAGKPAAPALKKRSSYSPSSQKSNSSPGDGQPVKKVHWYHKVEKKRHHRLQDLTPEEKESVWYTENDTKIILAMAKVTVKMMMKGEHCDDVDYCSRGLEGKTPVGSKRRQKNKLRVRKSLLEEQEIQRDEGVNDPEYLSQVSIKYSADVVQHAHNVAVEDERVIQDYLQSTRDDLSLPIPTTRMNR